MEKKKADIMLTLSLSFLKDLKNFLNLVRPGLGDKTKADLESNANDMNGRIRVLDDIVKRLELVKDGVPTTLIFGSVGMDAIHRGKLQSCFSSLMNDLPLDDIQPLLEKANILLPTHSEKINAHPKDKERIKAFLDILPTRGPNAYQVFCDAVYLFSPWLTEALNHTTVTSKDVMGEGLLGQQQVHQSVKEASGLLYRSVIDFRKTEASLLEEYTGITEKYQISVDKLRVEKMQELANLEERESKSFDVQMKNLKEKLRSDIESLKSVSKDKIDSYLSALKDQYQQDKRENTKDHDDRIKLNQALVSQKYTDALNDETRLRDSKVSTWSENKEEVQKQYAHDAEEIHQAFEKVVPSLVDSVLNVENPTLNTCHGRAENRCVGIKVNDGSIKEEGQKLVKLRDDEMELHKKRCKALEAQLNKERIKYQHLEKRYKELKGEQENVHSEDYAEMDRKVEEAKKKKVPTATLR